MAEALRAALECRDADTFQQLAALLKLYAGISSSVATMVQDATVSVLSRVRFNSSALVAAYFELLKCVFGMRGPDTQFNSIQATFPAGRATVFLDAMRSAATVLASCTSVPVRVSDPPPIFFCFRV